MAKSPKCLEILNDKNGAGLCSENEPAQRNITRRKTLTLYYLSGELETFLFIVPAVLLLMETEEIVLAILFNFLPLFLVVLTLTESSIKTLDVLLEWKYFVTITIRAQTTPVGILIK